MKKRGKAVSLLLSAWMAVSVIQGTSPIQVQAKTDEQSSEEKAWETVRQMSLEEKIGQKLMLSFRSGWTMEDGTKTAAVTTVNDEIYDIIGTYDIGSVILFAANFDADAKVNVELTNGLQKAATDESLGKNSIPLLIGADQEGGIVYRLTGGTALPGNMALGASNDVKNAEEAGRIIGSELSAVGVNTNFGPVADVNNNANNPVIGLRSFSSDPNLAADFTAAYIKGVHEKNVATSAKHFPGHGNVTTDSHTGLPSVAVTKEELEQVELVPFKAAIEAGTDMIMTAHIQFPNIVKEKVYSDLKDEWITPPATLSREILTDLLRDEMGFEGVIVTDSMTMDGVAAYFDVNERNLLAVKAGVDILDIPFPDMASLADVNDRLVPLISAFKDAYTKEDGYNGIRLSLDELDESVFRILKMKYERGIMDQAKDETSLAEKQQLAETVVGSVENREKEREIAANAVTVVKNENDLLPLQLNENSRVLFATTYSRNNNRFVLAWERAKKAGLIPEGADYKILQHYNWTGLPDQVNSAINSDGTNFSGTNQDLLDWCTVLVHVSEISSASEIDGYKVACPQLFIDYCEKNGKDTVAVSLNQPYDVQAFSKADAIVAVYGTTSAGVDITESFGGGTVSATAAFSPNLTAGIEVILGTFGAKGKLPVDIPRYISKTGTYSDEIVYPLGHGITYDSLVPDADKTALQQVIATVEQLDLSRFNEESVAAASQLIIEMKTALATAKETNFTCKLAQSVVDEAKTALKEKYDAVLSQLVYATDKTELSMLIASAGELNESDYTKSSWTAFAAALDKARETMNANVDQNAVDESTEELSRAMKGLKKLAQREDKESLYELLERYDGYSSKDYTADSWQKFKEAYECACEIYKDEQASADEVSLARTELKKAAETLVKTDPSSGSDDGNAVQTHKPPAANTGTSMPIAPFAAIIIICAAAAVYLLYRRNKNK